MNQSLKNVSLIKMLTSRLRACTDSIVKRQRQRKFLDVTSSGTNIPLAHIDWLERWCTLPLDDLNFIQKVYEFEVKSDDIYVVTFPKCGTTWIQEATWLLRNNLDFQTARNISIATRSVYMEYSGFYKAIIRNTLDLARNSKEPRVLKSHLPAHLIPRQIWQKGIKVVYCARNPKDMAVSFYHFLQGLGTWQGTLDEFVEDLINNDIMYSSYWNHLIDFWKMRHEPNVFFTTFEEMKRDLRKVIVDLNHFMENADLSEEDLMKLEEHLSFESMKANPQTNLTFAIKSGHASPNVRPDFEFMRRGIVGSYKNELTLESQEKLEKWTIENLLKHNVTLEEIFGKF
ncbi:sulfotransferase 1E1-like [Haematobia irritans]|uniref:sulfotransferase 1E1-like n=1 Tax=Haematobia irritans TaxID=7368 RepID=UPI003F4FB642